MNSRSIFVIILSSSHSLQRTTFSRSSITNSISADEKTIQMWKSAWSRFWYFDHIRRIYNHINLLLLFCLSFFWSSLEVFQTVGLKSFQSRILLIFAMKTKQIHSKPFSHFLPVLLAATKTTNNFNFPKLFFAGMFTSFDIRQQQNSIESDWRRGNPHKLCVGWKWKSFSTFFVILHNGNLMNFTEIASSWPMKFQLFETRIIKFNFIVSYFRSAHCQKSTSLTLTAPKFGWNSGAEMERRTYNNKKFLQTNFSQDSFSVWLSSMAWKQTHKKVESSTE